MMSGAVSDTPITGPLLCVEIGGDRVATITLDRPDSRVNVIDVAFIDSLEAALSSLPHDLNGVILASAKRNNFVAGADLRMLLDARVPDQAAREARRFQRAINRLADLPFPSVAAINGAAIGGGFELALACDYRVCVESELPLLGLPEVQLGLLPAGGGCQRLPRLVGLSRGLALILAAKRLTPRRAQRDGAIDEVVHPAALMDAARALLGRGKRSQHPRWSRLDRAAERWSGVRSLLYVQAARGIRSQSRGHFPAPARALEAVRAGWEQGAGAGQAAEAVAFGELATGTVARNLVGLFLAGEDLKREQRDLVAHARPVETVGVVGAGFMGAGIAQAAAAAGYTVRLRDLEPDRVASALRSAQKLTSSAARKGRFSRSQAGAIASRLSGGVDLASFGRRDLVIEAVFEDVDLKRDVIADLERTVSPATVIASNTSSLPIGGLAAGAAHPERVVGMHFFSPVHKMPLLEVVRPEGAAEWAVATAVDVGRALGKTVIVVADGPGFYTTRVLALMIQEAGLLFEQGASIDDIDRAMTAFGFPVGPLALMDEVGIDVAAHIADILHRAFPGRFTSPVALQRMVEQGRRGRKSGHGFYDYSGRKKRPDPDAYALRSSTPATFPRGLIQRRLTLALINEAARCLEEGVIANPRDGDLGAVLGFGFPPFLGGPFRYVDETGAQSVVEQLRQFEYGYGEVFSPAGVLVDLAAGGGRFYA